MYLSFADQLKTDCMKEGLTTLALAFPPVVACPTLVVVLLSSSLMFVMTGTTAFATLTTNYVTVVFIASESAIMLCSHFLL